MICIAHRVNDALSLRTTPRHYGVEVDVRLHHGTLICAHDPQVAGEPFAQWLTVYEHALLVLNVKEEGLEPLVIPLLEQAGIEAYFLLDQGTPALVRAARAGFRKSAVRLSDVEGEAAARALAGHVDWVWLDGLFGLPGRVEILSQLRDLGYRTALVSPELHGRGEADRRALQRWIERGGCMPDAVCTDTPSAWEPLLGLCDV